MSALDAEELFEDVGVKVLSDAVIVATFTLTMRGKGSGAEVVRRAGTVWELEEDRMVRAVTYPSCEQALEAAATANA